MFCPGTNKVVFLICFLPLRGKRQGEIFPSASALGNARGIRYISLSLSHTQKTDRNNGYGRFVFRFVLGYFLPRRAFFSHFMLFFTWLGLFQTFWYILCWPLALFVPRSLSSASFGQFPSFLGDFLVIVVSSGDLL